MNLNKFKPNLYNILISLSIVIVGMIFGFFTAQKGEPTLGNLFVGEPQNLLILFVISYIIVSLILTFIKKE